MSMDYFALAKLNALEHFAKVPPLPIQDWRPCPCCDRRAWDMDDPRADGTRAYMCGSGHLLIVAPMTAEIR